MRRVDLRRSSPRRTCVLRAIPRCTILLVLALASTGCQGDPVDLPPPEGPFLYLVLGERSVDVSRIEGTGPRQQATLLSLLPDQKVEFRSAVRFGPQLVPAGRALGRPRR